MIFWAGILVGIVFAVSAVRMKFYESWAFLFNLILATYLGIYLLPTIKYLLPAAADTPYGNALTILAAATAAFLILHVISYTFFTSQFSIHLPKIFDTIGSGFLGFFGGLLIWSFASLLVMASPLAQNTTVKEIGLAKQFEQTNMPYLCWWNNLVNTLVTSRADRQSAEQLIDGILKDADKKPRNKPSAQIQPDKPAEPNKPAELNKPREPNNPPADTAEKTQPPPLPADVNKT